MNTMRGHRHRASGLGWVMTVIGLAVAIAYSMLPKISDGHSRGAKVGIAQAAVEENGAIAKALDAYRSDIGKYPSTAEGLQILFQRKGGSTDVRFNGPYMNGTYERNCKDPWGKNYEYKSPGIFNEDRFDLWSCGKNGKDDGGKEGSDDVKNWSEK